MCLLIIYPFKNGSELFVEKIHICFKLKFWPNTAKYLILFNKGRLPNTLFSWSKLKIINLTKCYSIFIWLCESLKQFWKWLHFWVIKEIYIKNPDPRRKTISNGFCFIIFFAWLAKSIINVARNSLLNFVVAEITHLAVSEQLYWRLQTETFCTAHS